MARHNDATGYLIELRNRESTRWFSIICDYAIRAQNATLTEDQINHITQVFLGNETYQPQTATPTTTTTPVVGVQQQSASTTVLFLEKLSNFTNFKQLSNTLELTIDKRITIIFGKNGAGKSSLCDAIKVLARPQAPEKPLNNVKNINTNTTSFDYKFNIDANESSWQISDGYGLFSDRIKYFDSTVAYKYLRGPANPESVVSIEPFRLEVFQYAGAFVRRLNQALNNKMRDIETETTQNIEKTQTDFSEFIEHEAAIADLSLSNCNELKELLTIYTPLEEKEAQTHEKSKSQLKRLKDATSEAGLRLQKTEFDILLQFSHSIKSFKSVFSKNSLRETANLSQRLNELKVHQTELAKSITPDDVNKSEFITFIQASKPMLDYENITKDVECPFCHRPFDDESLELCKKYHEFLLDKVGNDISDIQDKLVIANRKIQAVKDYSLNRPEPSSFPMSPILLDNIIEWVENIQACIPDSGTETDESKFEAYEDNELLEETIILLAKEVLARYRSIKIATGDTERLQKEISDLNDTIRKYDYRNLIENNKEYLEQLVTKIEGLDHSKTLIERASFSVNLRNITNKNKEAYRELVVSEFEDALNEEYKKLSNRDISDFGIQLRDTGADQSVELHANIGNTEIHRVLSEGEQKIHALALFYAEASVGDQHIIVFDDPVASFDYDYSARYARRLRDFAQNATDVQIIVLTHNWDYFVHMQKILNKANLNNELSIQVIEQCSIINEYTEKIDDLKGKIVPKLAEVGVFELEDKEFIAANMRRLIEAIINKRVFNSQRHQFKQTTINTSIFNQFTKLVPLETMEATKLVDIYSDISVPGHDDPRNHYANVERSDFLDWYDDICTIEADLKSRRP